MNRSAVALLGVVAALAGLVGAGTTTEPEAPPAAAVAASTSPVIGGSAVCPLLRSSGRALQSAVSVGARSGAPESGPGGVTALPLSSAGTPTVLPVQRPGQVAVGLFGDVQDDALVLRSEGPLAGGLEVEQLTRGTSGADRGLAGVRCSAPSTEAWFAGGSLGVGERSVLVLVAPDDTDALVDVRVWSAEGPVDARPGRGIPVPARGRVLLPLDELAPGRTGLVVHVQSTRGRAAAALRHSRVEGRIPQGVEWVPPSPPPAPQVVVPGIPVGPGARRLLIGNPGEQPAVVQLQISSGDGQFVPAGLDAVEVPAGATVTRDLTELTARSPAAVTVLSDGPPVVAVAEAVQGRRGAPGDFAYAGASEPLTRPALLNDVVVGPRTESTLMLAAPATDASVVVTPLAVLGAQTVLGEPRTLTVLGGRTLALPLSTLLRPGARGRLAVQVSPVAGSGPVHATRRLLEQAGGGPVTTATVLRSGAPSVVRPPVAADPGAVVPPR